MLTLERSVFDPMRRQIFPKLLPHHRFVIGPVAQIHLRLGVVFKHNQVGADAVEEPAVVTDDEKRKGAICVSTIS